MDVSPVSGEEMRELRKSARFILTCVLSQLYKLPAQISMGGQWADQMTVSTSQALPVFGMPSCFPDGAVISERTSHIISAVKM